MDFISVKAPAKVNLYLHVTGRRADGYHLLDSLFVFAEDGDVISVRKAEKLSLRIVGPYAGGLSNGEDNIVLKAARALAGVCGTVPDVEIVLEKNLPVASGIGGGSSDAAATLKALMRLWKQDVPAEKLHDVALQLGADVPSCLAAKAVQVSGIGDILVPAPASRRRPLQFCGRRPQSGSVMVLCITFTQLPRYGREYCMSILGGHPGSWIGSMHP